MGRVSRRYDYRTCKRGELTAYAAIPTQTLAICVETASCPLNIFNGIKGAAVVFASTMTNATSNTTLENNGRITHK